MRLIRNILFIVIAISIFNGCTKEDRENTIIAQEAAIDKYISGLTGKRVERLDGSNRVVIDEPKKSAPIAEIGDTIEILYAGHIFSNGPGELFITNNPEIAKDKEFPLQEAPLRVIVGKGELISGVEKGLVGVGEGEHSYIIFSAKYGFNNNIVGNIPKLSPLLYEIWVEKVIKVTKK